MNLNWRWLFSTFYQTHVLEHEMLCQYSAFPHGDPSEVFLGVHAGNIGEKKSKLVFLSLFNFIYFTLQAVNKKHCILYTD